MKNVERFIQRNTPLFRPLLTACFPFLLLSAFFATNLHGQSEIAYQEGGIEMVQKAALVVPACIPSPTAPANGASLGCQAGALILSWPASPGATEYDVYLGTNPIPPYLGTTMSTNFSTVSTLVSGTYYWQVRPRNIDGTASGCTIWSFTIVCPPPSCINVTGMFPANGSVFNCPITAAVLSWVASSGATEYDIYLGTNPTPPYFATTMNTSYLLPANLPSGIYYWQLRPRNNSGTATGCPILSFSLCPPPACISPAAIFPVNGSVFNCPITGVVLSWAASTGATEYDIYLGTNPTPPFFATTMNTSYLLPANLPSGIYYWQLRPRNNGGTASGCPILSFSLCPPPSCVDVAGVFPGNGYNFACPFSPLTFSWPAVPGALEYDIYLGTNATPPFIATVTNPFLSLPNGLAAGNYNWQIRPRNTGGVASGCPIWSFSTIDNLPPVYTQCSGNITVPNTPNQCSGTAFWPTPTASDNCGPTTIVQTAGPLSGATLPVGAFLISYKASDVYGNARTCSFTVTIQDTQPPTLSCPPNITANNDAGLCGAVKTYPLPIALDNCSIPAAPILVSGLPSGSLFPVGTTTNLWRVTDPSNNEATCSFTVTVFDIEKPKITCPPEILKGNDIGFCSAKIPYLGSPVFTDNCFVMGVSNNSPVTFPVGSSTVTWIVSDNHGNTASCFQNVTIEDREYPVLQCPANIHVKTDEEDCIATVGYKAKATDNCAGLVVAYSIDPYAAFDIGLTNVDVTATDAAGNEVHCSFQISVERRKEVCNGLDDDCDGLIDEAEDWAKLAKQYGSDAIGQSEYGTSVDIDGDYAIVGSDQKNASGQSMGAAYILFRNKNGANAWGQITKLDAPGLSMGDDFGASVAISGGVAVVGAPLHDGQLANEGAVYVFYQDVSNTAQWNFAKKILAADADAGDSFGISVSLDGDRLVVGASQDDESGINAGAAYVFYRNKGATDNWGQVSKLMATTANANDRMGTCVAINGDYIITGATGVDGFFMDAGAAYIFGRNQFGPDAWGQVAKLNPSISGPSDNFGASVAISGPWVIVGAERNDQKGNDAGAAFTFYKNQNGINDSWGQSSILFDYNAKAGDRYGCAVAIDGEYAIVGAQGDDDFFGDDSGTGFVYLHQDNGWVLVGNLEDGGGQKGDALGSCAALSGRTAILGAPLDDAPETDKGSVLVFGGLCANGNRPEYRDDASATLELSVDCYPVPFSDLLNIDVKGMYAAETQVVILNALGETVASLYQGAIEEDMSFHWQSAKQEAGIYFLRVSAGGQVVVKPIVLVR